jgi:methionine-rich copper-binding protein CopC
MLSRRVRALLTALLLIPLFAVGVTTAQAHDHLQSSSPAAGSQVDRATEVTLTFSDTVVRTGTAVRVVGPDGSQAGEGAVQVSGSTVTQPLRRPLPAGAYKVTWRAISADGHPVSGTFAFSVAQGATASPPAASKPGITGPTSATGSSSAPTPPAQQKPTDATNNEPWLIVGAVVLALLLIGAGAAFTRTRLRDDAPADPRRADDDHDSHSDSTD